MTVIVLSVWPLSWNETLALVAKFTPEITRVPLDPIPRLDGLMPVNDGGVFTVIALGTITVPPSALERYRSRDPAAAPVPTSICPLINCPLTALRPGLTVMPLFAPNDTTGFAEKPLPRIVKVTEVAPRPTVVTPNVSPNWIELKLGGETMVTRSSVLCTVAPPSSFVRTSFRAPIWTFSSTLTLAVMLVALFTTTEVTWIPTVWSGVMSIAVRAPATKFVPAMLITLSTAPTPICTV